MKLKYIVAALGLMASAASQAALVVPDSIGSGEILLSVYDDNASYALDTGITYAQFLANSNTSQTLAVLSAATSANFASFVSAEGGNSANWQYGIIDAVTQNGSTATPAATLSTIDPDDVGQVTTMATSADVQSSVDSIPAYYRFVNVTGTHATTANGDSYNLAGTQANFYTSDEFEFNDLGNYPAVNATVGTAMTVERIARNASPGSVPTETVYPGMVNLTGAAGNYVLTYTVAAVPEASGYAMALAGFSALGFVGARRRNNRS